MNQFVQVQKLGHGTFGVALLVKERLGGDAHRVIKQIDVSRLPPDERSAAHQEVQRLLQLSHPHIVAHLSTFLEGYSLCIVREFVDGCDLGSAVRWRRQEGGRFEVGEMTQTIMQCLSALSYAHSLDVLHRNLECHNIFLTKAGDVKVGDFGIQKISDFLHGKAAAAMVAPGHLAPEVCQGAQYSSQADIWSIGVVLYTLLALRPPFESVNASALVNKIVHSEPADLPQEASTQDIRDVIGRALQKQPEHRPSAADLLVHPAFASASLVSGHVSNGDCEIGNKNLRSTDRRVRRTSNAGSIGSVGAEGLANSIEVVATWSVSDSRSDGEDAVDRLVRGAVNPDHLGCTEEGNNTSAVGLSGSQETASNGAGFTSAQWSLRDAPPLKESRSAAAALAARISLAGPSNERRAMQWQGEAVKKQRKQMHVERGPPSPTPSAGLLTSLSPETLLIDSTGPSSHGGRLRSSLALAGGAVAVATPSARPSTNGGGGLGALEWRPGTSNGGVDVSIARQLSEGHGARGMLLRSSFEERTAEESRNLNYSIGDSIKASITDGLPAEPNSEDVSLKLDELMGELMAGP